MPVIFIANDNIDKLDSTAGLLASLLKKEPAAKDYKILTASTMEDGIEIVERCQKENTPIDIAAIDAYIVNRRQKELSSFQLKELLAAFRWGGAGVSHCGLHDVVRRAFPDAKRIYWSGGLETTGLFNIRPAETIDMVNSRQYPLMARLMRDWITNPATRELPPVTPDTLEARYPDYFFKPEATPTLLGRQRKELSEPMWPRI